MSRHGRPGCVSSGLWDRRKGKSYKPGLLLDNNDTLAVVLAQSNGGVSTRCAAAEDGNINLDGGVMILGVDDGRRRYGESSQEAGESGGHCELKESIFGVDVGQKNAVRRRVTATRACSHNSYTLAARPASAFNPSDMSLDRRAELVPLLFVPLPPPILARRPCPHCMADAPRNDSAQHRQAQKVLAQAYTSRERHTKMRGPAAEVSELFVYARKCDCRWSTCNLWVGRTRHGRRSARCCDQLHCI